MRVRKYPGQASIVSQNSLFSYLSAQLQHYSSEALEHDTALPSTIVYVLALYSSLHIDLSSALSQISSYLTIYLASLLLKFVSPLFLNMAMLG